MYRTSVPRDTAHGQCYSQTKSPILHGRLVSYSSINPVISKSNICLAAGTTIAMFPPVLVREIRSLLTHRRGREMDRDQVVAPWDPFYGVHEVTSGVTWIHSKLFDV